MSTLANKNYFDWLRRQITIPPHAPQAYLETFSIMYETEFAWTIPGDDNRCQDGRDLRTEFQEQSLVDEKGLVGPVSVLEVLVALSRKVAFAAGGEPFFWAWQLFENLGLEHYPDPLNGRQKENVRNVLHNLIWRNYDPNGFRGFFPLRHTVEDQRRVELWKQMQTYVNEIDIPS